jgi:hypothetical protein
MNQNIEPSRPRWRWRRLLQFRLRTLLLFTFLVGLGIWAYQRYTSPPPFFQDFPGGLTLQNPLGDPASPPRAVRFAARDQYGRVVCEGVHVQGLATGWWTYYHRNGRPALRGRCRDGARVGTWTAWNEQGRKVAEIQHGEPRVATAQTDSPITYVQAGEQWWDNGQRRSSGAFVNDQPHGTWTFWNVAGEKTMEGQYDHGRRVGTWTTTNGDSGAVQIDYVLDRPVPQLDEWLAARDRNLASDDWRTRHDAAQSLRQAGLAALPQWTRALRSSHAEIQQFALEALARFGPRAAEALPDIDRLTRSADANVASEAHLAAWAIDVPHRAERFPRWLQFLKTHADARHLYLLRRAVEVGPDAVPALEQALAGDDAEIRLLAVVILGELFTHAMRPHEASDLPQAELFAILQRAARHDDPRVAAHAEQLLSSFQQSQAGGIGGMGGGGAGTGGFF